MCARKSILIANPYFVPNTVALDTLIEAKRRGVDVRINGIGHPKRTPGWRARMLSGNTEPC